MSHFLSGAIMMGCLVVATFFWRFWRRTNDRLFAWFALSFLILGVERLTLLVTGGAEATSPLVYLMRIVAFALIALAIVEKNCS